MKPSANAARATRALRQSLSSLQDSTILRNTLHNVAAALDGTGPALVTTDPQAPPTGITAPETVSEHLAAIVPTSGSTGLSRQVLLSREALRHSALATAEYLGGHGQWLLTLPPHYIAGFQVLTRSALAATTPVVIDSSTGFTVHAFLEAVNRLNASRTYVSLVPTQLQRLLTSDNLTATVPALRQFHGVLVGGAALPETVLDTAKEHRIPLIRTYGSCETSGGCVYNGIPLRGVTLSIHDSQVRISGPTIADGYLSPQPSDKLTWGSSAGVRWYQSHDIGTIEKGTLSITGRSDDVINSGGVKIAAHAISSLIQEDPRVLDCVVLKTSDPTWGETPVAFIESTTLLDAKQQEEFVDDTRQKLRANWGAHALPRAFHFYPELPRLSSGKPHRTELMHHASQERKGH